MKLMGKMICYFLVVLLVSTIGFGIVVYDSMYTKKEIELVQKQELPQMVKANELIFNVVAQSTNIRAFIMNGDEQMAARYKRFSDENLQISRELLNTANMEERRRIIQNIIDLDARYSEAVERTVFPLVRQGRTEEAIAAYDIAFQHYENLLREANNLKDIYLNSANHELVLAVNAANQSITVSIIAAIVTIILGMGIAIYSSRTLVNEIKGLVELAKKVASGDLTSLYKGDISKDELGELATALNTMTTNLRQLVTTISAQAQNVAASSEELTASADQSAQASQMVAGSITEVAGGTSQQLSSIKTTNNIVEHMVAELEEISSNISIVANGANKTAEMAINGGKSATKAIKQMNHVEKTVSESAKVVVQLGERSKEIGQIVDTISGIAGQTNLLALNAAIEAARAGEQGRGFAVVAEEVRKLAEQSQEASKRIAGLIGEIQVETTHAVAAMDEGTREVKIGADVVNETGVSFQEIIELIHQASDQINGIAKVVHSVAEGSEKIVTSVHTISELSNSAAGEIETVSAATEEQSASMEQIAAASHNLAKMAEDMHSTVAKFRT